jgi:hypothetical protein
MFSSTMVNGMFTKFTNTLVVTIDCNRKMIGSLILDMKFCKHMPSLVASNIKDQNFDYVKERNIMFCFLLTHVIGVLLNVIIYSFINFLLSKYIAQFAFMKLESCRFELLL